MTVTVRENKWPIEIVDIYLLKVVIFHSFWYVYQAGHVGFPEDHRCRACGTNGPSWGWPMSLHPCIPSPRLGGESPRGSEAQRRKSDD